jgi:DNA invertase Pin-like site-specific DNA recombinase
MKKCVLYIRVSTDKQNYNRQIDDLKKYCNDKNYQIVEIISEIISGNRKKDDRPGINQLYKIVNDQKIDKIVITELSRLGRDAYTVNTIIHDMIQKGVSIVIQSLNIETLNDDGKSDPLTDLMITVINQFSQMERMFLIDRINSGLQRARKNGKILGRKIGSIESQDEFLSKYKPVIKDLINGISIRKCCKIHSVSLKTVSKIRKLIINKI